MTPPGISKTVDRNAVILSRRVPIWALGIGFILAIILTGVFFLKDPILSIYTNSADIAKLRSDIAHCQEIRDSMQREIDRLEKENNNLGDRVSALESRIDRMQ